MPHTLKSRPQSPLCCRDQVTPLLSPIARLHPFSGSGHQGNCRAWKLSRLLQLTRPTPTTTARPPEARGAARVGDAPNTMEDNALICIEEEDVYVGSEEEEEDPPDHGEDVVYGAKLLFKSAQHRPSRASLHRVLACRFPSRKGTVAAQILTRSSYFDCFVWLGLHRPTSSFPSSPPAGSLPMSTATSPKVHTRPPRPPASHTP